MIYVCVVRVSFYYGVSWLVVLITKYMWSELLGSSVGYTIDEEWQKFTSVFYSLSHYIPFVFQVSQENVEYIPTRITKVTAPKPAANPLQFIKVGPASLYKSAQEQLKKAEEIKKVTKEVRDEAEDWQSVSDALNVLK